MLQFPAMAGNYVAGCGWAHDSGIKNNTEHIHVCVCVCRGCICDEQQLHLQRAARHLPGMRSEARAQKINSAKIAPRLGKCRESKSNNSSNSNGNICCAKRQRERATAEREREKTRSNSKQQQQSQQQ